MNTRRCGPNSQFMDISSTYRSDQSFSDTGRMPPKITRAVSNIAISKAYIDHENPDRRVVTAYEKILCRPV